MCRFYFYDHKYLFNNSSDCYELPIQRKSFEIVLSFLLTHFMLKSEISVQNKNKNEMIPLWALKKVNNSRFSHLSPLNCLHSVQSSPKIDQTMDSTLINDTTEIQAMFQVFKGRRWKKDVHTHARKYCKQSEQARKWWREEIAVIRQRLVSVSLSKGTLSIRRWCMRTHTCVRRL